MNEEMVRKLYSILGHNGYFSRLGSLDCSSKQYVDIYVHGIDEVMDFARKWDCKRNIFIGRNPRDRDGNVIDSRVITFDIDHNDVHGKKDDQGRAVAANDEQHNTALDAGRKILELYPGGMLCSSGNGCLLLYPCHIERDALDGYYRKEEVFITQLNELVGGMNVKIDSTSYDQAVIKLIGTMSTKGDPQYRRLSRFLTYPNASAERSSLYDVIRQIETPNNSPSAEKFKGDPVQRLQKAQDSINHLTPDYLDDYDKWLKVGIVLKEFGIAGLHLWKEWSKKGTKYEEGICETKWESFEEIPELTLGSLVLWAKEGRDSSKPVSLSNSSYFDGLFQADSEPLRAITTGISSLDSVLRALPRGEITTIAARSGFGKSSFATTVAEHNRRVGRKVLYFSTEIATEYVMHKFVGSVCNIPTQNLIDKSFTQEDATRIKEYQKELLCSPLIICDEFSPKIELVRDMVESHKPDLLIYDHVTQSGTHWEYVAQFVRDLKELTTRFSLVTLLTAQLNEPPRSTNGVIGTSVRGDIRGSQEIIFLSGIFMILNNLFEVKTDIQPVELEITKNRFGISGMKIELHCNKATGRYM